MRHTGQAGNWLAFIRDFGDAIGGIMIGWGLAKELLGYGLAGATLILISIFIRFYNIKTPRP